MPQNSKDQLNSFLDSLDDKNLQAFSERGVAGLDDDSLTKFTAINSPIQQTPDQPTFMQNMVNGVPKTLDAIAGLGKMAYSGYNQLADLFDDQDSPLHDEAVATVIRGIPGSVGIPESRLGVGLSALGLGGETEAAGAVSDAVEGAGQKVASKVFQMGGLPATQAEGASKNLAEIANPENLSVLRNAYNTVMDKFGIQSLEDTLKSAGSKYPSATGEMQAAVSDYSGKKGAEILADPDASLQDLHNVVDATSKKLFKPWAYPGPNNAPPDKAALMTDLYQMKQDAMDKMVQWGQNRVKDLEDAFSPESLSAMDPDKAATVQAAAPRMLADARADAEALNQVAGLRKNIFLAKTSEKLNRLTPSNLNGSMNQLGMLTQIGGAAQAAGAMFSGEPSMAAIGGVVAGARSPIVGKATVLGVRGLYNNIPALDQAAQGINAFEAQRDQDNAQ